MYSERNTMTTSLNCLILGQEPTDIFSFLFGENFPFRNYQVKFADLSVANFKEAISERKGIATMNVWKVELDYPEIKKFSTEEDIKNHDKSEKIDGNPMLNFNTYYNNIDEDKKPKKGYLHIFIIPTSTGPSQQGVPLVFENEDEVLKKANSHWERLKEKLVKKIELEEFRVSDHIYKDSINVSGIPVINERPSFLLHSLPDFDNNDYDGYLHKEMLSALFDKVMSSNYLFLMGTSGSGKTRSLFELLCRTFGIYFSLSAGNGSRNLGSQDMDISISDLGQYLIVNDPDKNTLTALRFTRAMLLGRLFILNKLLDFHNKDVNRNFTPKQWLLMQLLPTRITGREDFWTTISRVFRELKQEDQDELINTFTANFETLIPQQKKLPIVIDESQISINTYKELFSTTQAEGQLRPFFSILLRTVLKLSTGNFLCLVLSGTGMSFDDINIYSASAIAKSGGITFKDFFSIHDGFYECNEMSEFIRRFLPLNDELIRATFNIFQGRRRFIVQFLENAILDTSPMLQTDMNEIVKNWQRKAIEFIIVTFTKTCFPFLYRKKHAWDKVKDIVILSMFSHYTKLVRGSGVSEMVQYGFAQLCELKDLADLNTLEKDAITVRIAEPIPILAFREYIKGHHPDELETQLYRNLCSVHYNASCAGFLFEPCLTIPLAELFDSKICKEHVLFTGIENIDKLDSLLSCKVTIRNFDDRMSIFSSNGTMKEGFNLPAYLNNPTTAFFMPEKEAGPDLVCIIEFHTPDGIIEIPAFLQAKLVKNPPKGTPEGTTDPHHFYPHGEKRTELKEKLRDEVLNCLKSKYCKAHELSWIRFLVTFPAETKAESKYIIHDRPERTVASCYNYSQDNELFIVIDPSNAEHNVLKVLKRVNNDEKLELERETKRTKVGD